MHLALTGLFRAKWSAAVHEEWIRALLRRRPDLSRQKIERTRKLMDLHATDALVTGYEGLIEGLRLPDPDDRHVLAAAIHAHANIIVTAKLRHFPAKTLGQFGIEPQLPDKFVLQLLAQAPGLVAQAARDHRDSLKNPPKTIEQYLDALRAQGLTHAATVLQGLDPWPACRSLMRGALPHAPLSTPHARASYTGSPRSSRTPPTLRLSTSSNTSAPVAPGTRGARAA